MLLERNQALIGTIVALIVIAGTFVAVIATAGGFTPGIKVNAEFEDAAGLVSGNFVYYAGVRVGRVDSVAIEPNCESTFGSVACVRVAMTIEADLPVDSIAGIGLQNALGKRIVNLTTGVSTTMFQEGETIPLASTTTPVDIPEVGDETVALLEKSDVDSLNVLTTALADVTDGTREDVTALLDGVERLTKVISDRREDLALLIQRGQVFIDAAATKDTEIVRIIDAFGSTLTRLAARRDDLRSLLRETASASNTAADLVSDERARIDRVLAELHTDLQIVDRHQVDLAHFFAYAGVSIEGFASIGYGGGDAKIDTPAWGNVRAVSLGAASPAELYGCGSAIDEFLTATIGPDPTCEEEIADGTASAAPASTRGGSADALARRSAFGSYRSLFTAALQEVAR